MPIEFRCTQCNKLLRTPDETAGRQAKCPECGMIVTVPSPGAAGPSEPGSGSPFGSEPPPPLPPDAPAESPFAPEGPQPTGDPDNPYASPADYSAAGYLPGAPAGAFTPTVIDMGDIFSRTWEIFKEQWGMCLLAMVVVWVINVVFQIAVGLFTGMIGAVANDQVIMVTFSVLGNLASSLFSIWIGIGQALFFLKIARGQDAALGDIFTGGPFFLNILLASILVGLICLVGLVALIVPGIVLSLMFSQFYYLILDRNVGVLDSLSLSKELTNGNKMTLFVIGVLAVFLMLAALIPCGLGLLIAVPYFALMYPVIYLAMTGQPTLR